LAILRPNRRCDRNMQRYANGKTDNKAIKPHASDKPNARKLPE